MLRLMMACMVLSLAAAGCPKPTPGPDADVPDAPPDVASVQVPVLVDVTDDAEAGRRRKGDAAPDATDVYGKACTNLARLGCPEAHPDGGECTTELVKIDRMPGLQVRAACIAEAKDKTGMAACHVRCQAR